MHDTAAEIRSIAPGCVEDVQYFMGKKKTCLLPGDVGTLERAGRHPAVPYGRVQRNRKALIAAVESGATVQAVQGSIDNTNDKFCNGRI